MLLFPSPLLVSTPRPFTNQCENDQSLMEGYRFRQMCPASRKPVMTGSPLRTPSIEPEQFLLPRHSASVLVGWHSLQSSAVQH
jgi:hypothetical protein